MDVRLDDALDDQAFGGCLREVDVNVSLRIDDDRATRACVTDQIGRMREAGQIVLREDHRKTLLNPTVRSRPQCDQVEPARPAGTARLRPSVPSWNSGSHSGDATPRSTWRWRARPTASASSRCGCPSTSSCRARCRARPIRVRATRRCRPRPRCSTRSPISASSPARRSGFGWRRTCTTSACATRSSRRAPCRRSTSSAEVGRSSGSAHPGSRKSGSRLSSTSRPRGRRVDECIAVCKRLWSEPEVTHHGECFSFEQVVFEPKPIQRPWPPILVGGESPAALRRAASHDGWVGISHTVESAAAHVRDLARPPRRTRPHARRIRDRVGRPGGVAGRCRPLG